MLEIIVPYQEDYDEETNRFLVVEETVLQLEHSLVSLRKWESRHHVPFLDNPNKTYEDFIDYIFCMDLHPENTKYEIYSHLGANEIEKIAQYVEDSMTASWITERNIGKSANRREKVTAELIYYWMFSLNIPIECENWHLNQLMMLIRVSSAKNAPETKMSQKERSEWIRQQNARNKAKYNTRG